jgi:hypothetical protein
MVICCAKDKAEIYHFTILEMTFDVECFEEYLILANKDDRLRYTLFKIIVYRSRYRDCELKKGLLLQEAAFCKFLINK